MIVLCQSNSEQLPAGMELDHEWSRPEPKFIKLNVDAAFLEGEGVGTTATIIRDERGFHEAEAESDSLQVITFVESDSVQVINFCNG